MYGPIHPTFDLDNGEAMREYGRYAYRRDGAPTSIEEVWSVAALPGGGERVRAVRMGPDATLRADAVQRASGVVRCRIELTNRQGPVDSARAEYELTQSRWLAIRRVVNEGEPTECQIYLPDRYVLYPLMRCFLGSVIRQVAARGRGAPVPVLVPRITDPHADDVLDLDESWRRAHAAGVTTVPLEAGPRVATEYQFVGGEYTADNARFWIDQHGRLLVYELDRGAQGRWRVELIEHQGAA